MKTVLLVYVVFIAGVACGRWDAKHGYDAGMKAGTATRKFLERFFE